MPAGRPRQYPDQAARQQAYRQRQAKHVAKVTQQAHRKLRKRDEWHHARYRLGVEAALRLRDAPPALLDQALAEIEKGHYDKEWLERGAPGPRFQKLIDYIHDVQAGRPLYALYHGHPCDIVPLLEPGSVDVIITDLTQDLARFRRERSRP